MLGVLGNMKMFFFVYGSILNIEVIISVFKWSLFFFICVKGLLN